MSEQNVLEKIKALAPRLPDPQVREMVSEFVRVLGLRVDEIAKLRASLAAAQRELEQKQKALDNCYMLAKRESHSLRAKLDQYDKWKHIIRLCEEVGCKSNPLREEPSHAQPQ